MVIAFLLLVTGQARADEPIAEIPYRYDYDGWITVEAFVNGEGPHEFIVDSAATLSVVFQNLAADQSFPFVEGDDRRILGLIETNALPPRRIGRIVVGGQAIDDVVSVVIDDWAPPRATPQGVLGLDFLSRYAVHIDPQDGVIRLYAKRPDVVKERGWSRTRLKRRTFRAGARPLYTTDVRIRGRQFPFIVDLGASGTMINYPALTAMLTTRRVTVRSAGEGSRNPKVQDLFGNERASRLVQVRRMSIGGVTWRDRVISVFDAEVFSELGVEEDPFGLLGADLLRDRQLVLDFPEQRLYLGPEQSGPDRPE